MLYQWKFGGLVMGIDPAPVDTVCLRIINEKRAERSFEPLVLPYLDWSRQEGLGMNRLGKVLIYKKAI